MENVQIILNTESTLCLLYVSMLRFICFRILGEFFVLFIIKMIDLNKKKYIYQLVFFKA